MRKKIILAVSLLTLISCSTLQAQGFVGGSFGFSASLNAGTSVTVAPNFGYFLTDRWVVGIMPSIGFSANSSVNLRALSLGVTPYVMYRLVSYERLGLWLEGTADMDYQRSRIRKVGPVNHTLSYGVRVLPALSFELSRHLVAMANFNMLSIGAYGVSVYDNEYGKWYNVSNSGLTVSEIDLTRILSDISLGFLFRF